MNKTLVELCENNNIYNIKTYDEWFSKIYNNKNLNSSPHIHTDKYYVHAYMPVYEMLFKDYRDKNINFLEIGVQNGGSLELFKTYFINGSLTGIDINNCPPWLLKSDRIKFFKANAYSIEILNSFQDESFDIIIDDGPHDLNSMLYVSKFYVNKLKKDGLLIIEDIPNIDWISNILKNIPPEFKYTHKVQDLRTIKNRFDDIMLVIKRL
jgi:hypothetical protein